MKKINSFISAVLVIIMMITSQIPAFAADDEYTPIMPKVVFSDFSVDKKQIYPGDIFTVTVTATNVKAAYVDDCVFKFNGGDAFSVYNSSDTEYTSGFSSSVTVKKTFICKKDTPAGTHTVGVSCEYNGLTSDANFSIMTYAGSQSSDAGAPVLVMSYDKFDKPVKAGSKFNFDFYITNKSSSYDVKNVNIKLNGGDVFSVSNGVDTVYKSSISKGATANITKKLVCSNSASSGMHPISVSITYDYTRAGAVEQGTAEATFTVSTSSKSSNSGISLTPRLVIGGFSYGEKTIKGGKKFNLSFSVKNNSKSIKAKNVIIKVSGGETFVVADGTDTISVDHINPNSSVSVSKNFTCLNSAPSGVYPIVASISYEYVEAGQKQQGTEELTMSVPVVQPDKVMFTNVDLADKTVTVGEESDCGFKLVNSGKTVLNNGTVKVLDSDGNELNSAYIGSIEPGEQYSSNYNLPITFNEVGEYKLTIIFEYENDNTDKKSIKQEFKVTAEEYVDPFPVEPDTPDDSETDNKSNSKKIVVGVIAGVALLAALIITAVVLKKKKHKKGKVDFNEEI